MPDSSCVPHDISTPAVVLGCFRQAGIGIVRSLGRLGVAVYAIDTDRFEAAFFSKYCRGSFRWDINRSSSNESLQFLIEVSSKIGRRAVLFPTSDIGAMFVAAQADQLAERFLFPDQPESLMRSLCSKKGMHDIAKRCKIPTPETSFPASKNDVRSYLSTARFPILVKPVYNNLSSDRRPVESQCDTAGVYTGPRFLDLDIQWVFRSREQMSGRLYRQEVAELSGLFRASFAGYL